MGSGGGGGGGGRVAGALNTKPHRKVKAFRKKNKSNERKNKLQRRPHPSRSSCCSSRLDSDSSLQTPDTSVFPPCLRHARHARAVLSTCVRRVCALLWFSQACVCVCVALKHTHTHTQTPLASLRPFSPLALPKLNNADGVSDGQVATCVKQQLPGALP